MNQCDGCRRGLPLRGRVHVGPTSWDVIGCTAHLYEPLLMQDENSGRDGRRYNEWHAARLNAREAAKAIDKAKEPRDQQKENE